MKNVILCADDYGQNTAISQAIIDLLVLNRLSAVSCLVTAPGWLHDAPLLHPFKDQADMGLHFNLTDGEHCDSLSRLLIKSHLRLLNKKTLIAECHAQIDQFVAGMGYLPDFIDGHQHVHQLPVIRDALIAVYDARLRQKKSYIRCVDRPHVWKRFNEKSFLKQAILQLCGAHAFRQLLVKNTIPHNASFAGIYDFNDDLPYPILFQRFLKQVEGGGLIMCHPGKLSSDARDPISDARVLEYEYLVKRDVTESEGP